MHRRWQLPDSTRSMVLAGSGTVVLGDGSRPWLRITRARFTRRAYADFDEALLAEFTPEESATYDALVFCDMTTGPTGDTVLFEDRLREIRLRYGPDHAVTVALDSAYSFLAACCERTMGRLDGATL